MKSQLKISKIKKKKKKKKEEAIFMAAWLNKSSIFTKIICWAPIFKVKQPS